MKKVREIRKIVGMRSGEMANILKMSSDYYSHIETGSYKIKNIEEIETRCLAILLPMLRGKIHTYKTEVKRLENILND